MLGIMLITHGWLLLVFVPFVIYKCKILYKMQSLLWCC